VNAAAAGEAWRIEGGERVIYASRWATEGYVRETTRASDGRDSIWIDEMMEVEREDAEV